jgi:hypothetical protein
MNNADDKLSALWKRARTANGDEPAEEVLAPGIATRIASRWAAGADRSSTAYLFERVTACFAVPAVIAFTLVWWQHPQPESAAHDLMSALFNARIEIEDDFPF